MQLHPRAVVPSRRAIIRSECARDRAPIHENMLIPMPPPPPAPPRHDSLHCSGLLAFFLAADLGLPMFLRVFVFGPPETFLFFGCFIFCESGDGPICNLGRLRVLPLDHRAHLGGGGGDAEPKRDKTGTSKKPKTQKTQTSCVTLGKTHGAVTHVGSIGA